MRIVFVLVALAGCKSVTCGEGTELIDWVCEAPEPPEPPEPPDMPDPLTCGPGTVEQDGECVAEPVPQITCGEGTVLREDTCIAVPDEWVGLPFLPGDSAPVWQSFHGYFSHNGSALYAIDFGLDEGDVIVAARGGRVLRTREDSNTGCGDPSCADQANYIVVDHGDGTTGNYWHLEYEGVDVEVGEIVARGQVLGRSGNTGFSTGPHLHFSVNDLYGQSLPVRFDELESSGGVAFSGGDFTSENTEQELDGSEDWSMCPEDLYAHMGVTLDPVVPCTALTPGEVFQVSGTVHTDGFGVMTALFNGDAGGWSYECIASEPGPFSTELSLPGDYSKEYTYLMISGASGDCSSFQGWDASPSLVVF